jgi:hypothetical protein
VDVVAAMSAKGPVTTPRVQVVLKDRSSLRKNLQKLLRKAVNLVKAIAVLLQCID